MEQHEKHYFYTSHQNNREKRRRRKPFQFRLASLMILAALTGAAVQGYSEYRKWRSSVLWRKLDDARQMREVVLLRWKVAMAAGKNGSNEEAALRLEYFQARADTEAAHRKLRSFYDIQGADVYVVRRSNGEKMLIESPADSAP